VSPQRWIVLVDCTGLVAREVEPHNAAPT
jgi:hypothetical protein